MGTLEAGALVPNFVHSHPGTVFGAGVISRRLKECLTLSSLTSMKKTHLEQQRGGCDVGVTVKVEQTQRPCDSPALSLLQSSYPFPYRRPKETNIFFKFHEKYIQNPKYFNLEFGFFF